MVAPGTYQARLTVGDWSETVSFEAKIDPRVVAEGHVTDEDLAAQVKLALDARDALSRSRLAVSRIDKALSEAEGTKKTDLEALRKELVTAPRRYSQPMLVDQLDYLYGNLDTADQRPGKDATDRYEALNRQLEELTGRLDELLGTTE